MIKNFTQFNEELSPQLLGRASVAAYGATNSQGVLTPQNIRGDKFYAARIDIERKEIDSKKKENYEAFMKLTGGVLLGTSHLVNDVRQYKCIVNPLKVNPGGETEIEIQGYFTNKKEQKINKIFIDDALIKNNQISIVVSTENLHDTQHIIPLNELVLDRKDAMVYAKFLNWWKGTDIAFNKNDYCIKNIHI